MTTTYTVFVGQRRLAAGDALAVAPALRAHAAETDAAPALVFENKTGRQVDLDLSGDAATIAARYGVAEPAPAPAELVPPTSTGPAPAGPGRPKLGVVAREVTLLPRHWDWLASQPGGASVALRKLVDKARKEAEWDDLVRGIREATNRFLTAIAGDLPHYEAATRALFAGDREGFEAAIAGWPEDIRDHAREMAQGGFA